MSKLYLSEKEVPPHICGSYSGKKFAVTVCEETSFNGSDLSWSGGSKTTVDFVRLSDGAVMASLGESASTVKVKTVPGIVIRAHVMFCGKDLGLEFYVNPHNAAGFTLAATPELSETERKVLKIIRAYKSSYRREEASREGIPAAQYDATLEALKANGMLAANGALTVAGKNAARGL